MREDGSPIVALPVDQHMAEHLMSSAMHPSTADPMFRVELAYIRRPSRNKPALRLHLKAITWTPSCSLDPLDTMHVQMPAAACLILPAIFLSHQCDEEKMHRVGTSVTQTSMLDMSDLHEAFCWDRGEQVAAPAFPQ